MEKDLSLCGEQYRFKEQSGTPLIEELGNLLKKLDRGTFIINLLYRVDLQHPHFPFEKDYYTHLSEAIWNRVLIKVWYRKEIS